MDPKRVATLVVGVIAALVIFTALLIPVVSDSTATTKTYHNEGVPFALASSEDTTTHTIIIDATGLTSDGVSVDSSSLPGSFTIVFGEHSILRYDPVTGAVSYGGSAVDGGTQQWSTRRNGSTEEVLTITINGTLLTWVNGESTGTIEDQWAYISNDGNYRYLLNPCVISDSRIIGGGVTYSPFASATVICFDGTIEAIDAGIYRSSPAATLDEVRVVTSTMAGDLKKIDAIYFDCTQSDTDKTATYTYFLAPYEIVYDNPNYVGSTLASLIGVIPIIVMIGIVLAVVGVAIVGRNDY